MSSLALRETNLIINKQEYIYNYLYIYIVNDVSDVPVAPTLAPIFTHIKQLFLLVDVHHSNKQYYNNQSSQ